MKKSTTLRTKSKPLELINFWVTKPFWAYKTKLNGLLASCFKNIYQNNVGDFFIMFKNVKFSLISLKLARITPLYTPLLQPVCSWSADLNQTNIFYLHYKPNGLGLIVGRGGGDKQSISFYALKIKRFFICRNHGKLFTINFHS